MTHAAPHIRITPTTDSAMHHTATVRTAALTFFTAYLCHHPLTTRRGTTRPRSVTVAPGFMYPATEGARGLSSPGHQSRPEVIDVASRRVLINGTWQIDPRETWEWKHKLKPQVIREEPTCRLRFPGICTIVSTTADHIVPVSERPELALVRTNLRGACSPCNDARKTVPDEALRLDSTSPALSIFRR